MIEPSELETIVEYSATKAPFNGYPDWIVSPPESSACCLTEMRRIGDAHSDENGSFFYKQCPVCTYTVRQFTPRSCHNAALAGWSVGAA